MCRGPVRPHDPQRLGGLADGGPHADRLGTRDQKIIADAVAQIPEVEWRVLKDKLKMVDQIDATDERRLELASKELPPEMR